MQQMKPVRRQRLLGAAALAVITILSVIAALLYTRPPNERIVSFYTDDAASIHPGDTVRIAGIVVGSSSRPSECQEKCIYRRPVSGSSSNADHRRWLLRHDRPTWPRASWYSRDS